MTTYNVVQTMSLDQIQDRFVAMGRGDTFSIEALKAIVDLLEDCNEGYIDLDVIAICCEFTETSLSGAYSDFDLRPSDYMDIDCDEYWESDEEDFDLILSNELLTDLNTKTWAVELGNGNILYMNY